MADLLKEIFCFQIIKLKNSFLNPIMSDGELKHNETIFGKKQEAEKIYP